MVLHSHRWEDLLEVWVRQREKRCKEGRWAERKGHGKEDRGRYGSTDREKETQTKREKQQRKKRTRQDGEQKEIKGQKKMKDRVKPGWKQKRGKNRDREGRNKKGSVRILINTLTAG